MRLILAFAAMLALVGCDKLDLRGPRTTASAQAFSIDGIKLVSPSIQRLDDERAYGQSQYEISPESRLLLRFEALSKHADNVVLEADKTVKLRIRVPTGGDKDRALRSARICPVTKAWMMLATWEVAHPFGTSGRWQARGGDFDLSGCVTPTTNREDATLLDFDVKRWFLDYPRGRQQNHGLLLMSSESFLVEGDRSGSYSPRILFVKWVSF